MIGSIIGPLIGLTTPGGGGGPPPVVETRFVSTWDTTQAGSASDTIILPMTAGNLVDWGDGTVNNLNTHTYSVGGVKTVKIGGVVTGFRFNNGGDKSKLITIENWGGFTFSTDRAFFGCSNLVPILATDTPLITHPLGLQIAFLFCSSMTSITGVSNWNTSICTSLDSFLSDTGMTGVFNLSSWDTSNVNIMTNTFKSSSGITGLGVEAWDVSMVTNMSDFLRNITLPTPQYNNLWINYGAQALQSNVPFHGGNSVATGAGLTARNLVASTFNWTITDAS